jgi:hypothetical protein
MKPLHVAMVLILLGCGIPREEDVRAEFLADNHGAAVESTGPGEGDASNVYFHIRYRLPGDSTLWEQVWLYQKDADGLWHVTSRDTTIVKRAT